jgi:hypothetical protein
MAFSEAHMLIYKAAPTAAGAAAGGSLERLGDGDDGWIDTAARRSTDNGTSWTRWGLS